MNRFLRWLLLVVGLVVVVGCGRVNGDNYLKIKDGMRDDEVKIILGEPTKKKVLGDTPTLYGEVWTYQSGDKSIELELVNGVVCRKDSKNL